MALSHPTTGWHPSPRSSKTSLALWGYSKDWPHCCWEALQIFDGFLMSLSPRFNRCTNAVAMLVQLSPLVNPSGVLRQVQSQIWNLHPEQLQFRRNWWLRWTFQTDIVPTQIYMQKRSKTYNDLLALQTQHLSLFIQPSQLDTAASALQAAISRTWSRWGKRFAWKFAFGWIDF